MFMISFLFFHLTFCVILAFHLFKIIKMMASMTGASAKSTALKIKRLTLFAIVVVAIKLKVHEYFQLLNLHDVP